MHGSAGDGVIMSDGCLSQEGDSALHYASAYNQTATVMVLMEYGTQVNLLNINVSCVNTIN